MTVQIGVMGRKQSLVARIKSELAKTKKQRPPEQEAIVKGALAVLDATVAPLPDTYAIHVIFGISIHGTTPEGKLVFSSFVKVEPHADFIE